MSSRTHPQEPYISQPLLALQQSVVRVKRYALRPTVLLLVINSLLYALSFVGVTALILHFAGVSFAALLETFFANSAAQLSIDQLNSLATVFARFIPVYLVIALAVFLPLKIALDYVIIRSQEHAATNTKTAWKQGYRRLAPAIVAYFLAGIAVLGGLFLFILPGLYLVLRFSYLNAVIAREEIGPIDALRRSWQLTKGNLWDIIGVMSLGVIITAAISISSLVLALIPADGAAVPVLVAVALLFILLLNVVVGLAIQASYLFRYHQSALEKQGRIEKTVTDPLNYYLATAALVLFIIDRSR